MLCFERFAARLAQNSLNFALVLLIADATDSGLLTSLLVLALVIPSMAGGMVAGAASDVLPRRLLIVSGDVLRAGICVVFFLYGGGTASYYLVAAGLAASQEFASNAEATILPLIVERPQLIRANALGQAVGGVAQLAGYGVLTPLFLRLFDSPEALFLVAAGLYVVAAFYALAIGAVRAPARREVGGEPAGPWWLVGWRTMRSDPRVMHAASEAVVISSALIILAGLIPGYIKDVLGLPVDIGAVILMPAAIGVALGLRVAGLLAHRVSHTALSSTGFVAFVVLLALVTFVNTEARFLGGYGVFSWLNSIDIGSFDGGGFLAMVFVLPLGFAYALVVVSAQTVLQDLVPLRLQGRVFATQGALAAIASSVPVLLAGALSDVAGVTPAMAVLTAATAAAAILNLRSPSQRVERGVSTHAGSH
jgi:MFS family permease